MKPNTQPRHPLGLPGIQAAPLSHHVRPSGTHQALNMPARNMASARALAVLNIELETGPFSLEPNTRCALGMLSTARPNCHMLRCREEEEEEDLFVFNDTIEGPRAPAVKPGRVTQA